MLVRDNSSYVGVKEQIKPTVVISFNTWWDF